MKMPNVTPNVVLIAISLLAVTGLGGCGDERKTLEAPSPKVGSDNVTVDSKLPQVASLLVETVKSSVPGSTQLYGRLVWNDDVTVRVFTPFGGHIRKIIAQTGQTLEKGAPLAEIESPDFGQAQADARTAKSALQLEQRNLARLRELFAHGAAALKDVEAAEANEARAESEYARAVSKLQAYGANAESINGNFVLRSPIAGAVVERNVNPGQEVRPDQMLANMPQFTAPLFVISDPARLWIQIDATEADLPKLQSGREFAVTSRAFPVQTLSGRIENISQFIDPTTRTIKVRGAVNNPNGLLKAEMFVNVTLPDGEESVVTVPAKSVFLKGEKHYVFVEERPGQYTRKEVKTGSEQNGHILILNGLQPGQRVVTDGSILLEQMME